MEIVRSRLGTSPLFFRTKIISGRKMIENEDSMGHGKRPENQDIHFILMLCTNTREVKGLSWE